MTEHSPTKSCRAEYGSKPFPDCVESKPFATIAAHDTFVGTVEVLWNKTLVSLMDHVQIWDTALLYYEQPSN